MLVTDPLHGPLEFCNAGRVVGLAVSKLMHTGHTALYRLFASYYIDLLTSQERLHKATTFEWKVEDNHRITEDVTMTLAPHPPTPL